MISRSDFESITESASSLDYNPRSRVQGSIFAGDGDPYLRVSKDTESEILRRGEEEEGPEGVDADLKRKIDEWKAHAQEFKTGAGFRKASRGKVDPRRFALHLSRIALRHAQQYGSKSLLKISKRLKWAASQSRKIAEKELHEISKDGPEDHDEFPGRPQIVKPGVPPIEPQWGPQRGIQPMVPGAPPDPEPAYPGATREEPQSRSWSAEQTASRRRANDESNSDLVQYALDFLEDYVSTNSLADDEALLDKLNESEVFESWVVDLDNRGVLADPQDLDEAWNQALSEMTNESPEPEEELSSGITTSKKPSNDPDDPRLPEPPEPAPGGDPMNMVADSVTYPGNDRYLRQRERVIKREMHGHKKDYGWAGKLVRDDYQSSMDFIARRAKSEEKDDDYDEDVKQAADQCLDHLAGEMTPDQISPEDVRQFVEGEYPDVDWQKVYEIIAEITDPKKRHEKERTNDDYHASRSVQTTRRRPSPVTRHYVSAFDTVETTPHRRYSHLHGHREICACCTGTGQEGAGACSRCQGKGRHGLDPDDPQIAAKSRVIEKVGSLLLVEVNPNQLAPKGRQALSQVTRTRAASGNRVRYTHSPELMRFLVNYDVPFKMVDYKHPNY